MRKIIRTKTLSVKANKKTQKGAAAVEFAIVAPVFLALFFSICEIGWVSFVQSVAERANSEIARNIQTGQIQNISTENDPNAQRREVFDRVCDFAQAFGDCEETVTVEVETFASFQALAMANSPITCANAASGVQNTLNFDPGQASAIVRVRTCLLYETLNPAVGLNLKATNGEPNRIVSQLLFRNEPFDRNVRGGGNGSGGGSGGGSGNAN